MAMDELPVVAARRRAMTQILPVGKVPRDVLERLLARAPSRNPRVLLGPGIGLDCAVVEVGNTLLVIKSDPITFATDAIGWYLVQVTANDLATTGATPHWLLLTIHVAPRGAHDGHVARAYQ
jgi:hydrogenase expression/formation protein HypE